MQTIRITRTNTTTNQFINLTERRRRQRLEENVPQKADKKTGCLVKQEQEQISGRSFANRKTRNSC